MAAVYLIVLTVSISIILAGCEGNDSGQPDLNDVSTTKQPETLLTTGIAESKIEWRIQKVEMKQAYYTPSLEYIDGDAVLISGEALSLCQRDCDFFENETTSFMLIDKQDRIYQQQASIIEEYDYQGGTRIIFSVWFSTTFGFERNWGNYRVKDPVESNKNLPGHINDLSAFNPAV